MKMAFDDAGIDPAEIDYVNAHAHLDAARRREPRRA